MMSMHSKHFEMKQLSLNKHCWKQVLKVGWRETWSKSLQVFESERTPFTIFFLKMSTSPPPPTTKITTSTSPSRSPTTTSTTTSNRGKLKKIRRTSQHSSERDEDELRGRSSPMLSPNGSARGNSGDKKSRDSTTDSDSTPKKLIRIRRVSSSSKRRRGSADLGPSLMTRVTATVVSPDAADNNNSNNDGNNKTQLTMLANPRTQLLFCQNHNNFDPLQISCQLFLVSIVQ